MGERHIRIRYDSWKAVVTRDLDPLGLVLKGGAWYLVAAAKGSPRTYRVASILAQETLDQPVARPARFDLETYWTGWSREFEARMLSERAVIRISPLGRLLREASPAAAQAIEARHTLCRPTGWVRAEIPIESVAAAAGQMLHLGAEAVVVSPPALRAAVAAEAAAIAGLYVQG